MVIYISVLLVITVVNFITQTHNHFRPSCSFQQYYSLLFTRWQYGIFSHV